jgi:hypothetical protein
MAGEPGQREGTRCPGAGDSSRSLVAAAAAGPRGSGGRPGRHSRSWVVADPARVHGVSRAQYP